MTETTKPQSPLAYLRKQLDLKVADLSALTKEERESLVADARREMEALDLPIAS